MQFVVLLLLWFMASEQIYSVLHYSARVEEKRSKNWKSDSMVLQKDIGCIYVVELNDEKRKTQI